MRPLSLWQFFKRFPDEEAAVRFIESRRWPDGPACPHCGSVNVAAPGKPMPYRCRDCRKHFSVRTGTIFAHSKLPLQKWLMAAYLLTTARKGMSSVQLAKHLGVTQKTAWFLAHRIREGFREEMGMLGGTVEADETYIGGKEANKHRKKRLGPLWQHGKKLVAGLRERTGRVVVYELEHMGGEAFAGEIEKRVRKGSTMYTDGHYGYQRLSKLGYRHEAVNHERGEYVRGPAHCNSVESIWAVLKRQYIGTHHWISFKHLHRYLDEFAARLNGLHGSGSCLGQIVRRAEGKRLTYRDLVG